MNGNNERFKEAFNYLKYTERTKDVTSFAKQLGRNRSYVSSILSGKADARNELLILLHFKFPVLNLEWLLNGYGNITCDTTEKANIVRGDNANNSIVGFSNSNCNLVVGDKSPNRQIPNKYGDSPSEERKWAPVVPTGMAKAPGFDIMGHISKQVGGSFERLYAGTAPVDVWHYVTDNDLYPHYQKGDCLGLKAYATGDCRIKTGNVYVVDSVRDGFIFRRFRLNGDGDLVSYTFSDSDPQEFVIPKEDVIRVYSVVLMFRY